MKRERERNDDIDFYFIQNWFVVEPPKNRRNNFFFFRIHIISCLFLPLFLAETLCLVEWMNEWIIRETHLTIQCIDHNKQTTYKQFMPLLAIHYVGWTSSTLKIQHLHIRIKSKRNPIVTLSLSHTRTWSASRHRKRKKEFFLKKCLMNCRYNFVQRIFQFDDWIQIQIEWLPYNQFDRTRKKKIENWKWMTLDWKRWCVRACVE